MMMTIITIITVITVISSLNKWCARVSHQATSYTSGSMACREHISVHYDIPQALHVIHLTASSTAHCVPTQGQHWWLGVCCVALSKAIVHGNLQLTHSEIDSHIIWRQLRRQNIGMGSLLLLTQSESKRVGIWSKSTICSGLRRMLSLVFKPGFSFSEEEFFSYIKLNKYSSYYDYHPVPFTISIHTLKGSRFPW